MLPYWVFFGVPASMALAYARPSRSMWWVLGIALTLVIGLRYQVGGDWTAYVRQIQEAGLAGFWSVILGREPGYQLLNWIAYVTDTGMWFVNLFCAAIFTAGLFSFARSLREPLLALTIAMPYLVIIVSMGYTRQAAAIGLILLGLRYFQRNQLIRFLIMILLAALFHRTALMFAGYAVLAMMQRNIWAFLWMVVCVFGMYQLFLAEQQADLLNSYVGTSYAQKSEGGALRVAMTATAATVFLLLGRRFKLPKPTYLLWFWASLSTFPLFVLALSSPTAADRMALYLLPIQILTGSYFPSAFGVRAAGAMRILVVFFYALTLFVWLFFAGNRNSWLPYQFWPTVTVLGLQ